MNESHKYNWPEYQSLRVCYAVVTSPGDLTLQQHYCQDLKPRVMEWVHRQGQQR
jgi:hypothetical protein